MPTLIRKYRPDDEAAVVALSLRAWTPVFASLEQVLGGEIFGRLHDDWCVDQAGAVRGVLADEASEVWVGEAERVAVGFVAMGRRHPAVACCRSQLS